LIPQRGTLTSLYAIGRVVKAFGIKGEVVVQPMTDSVSRFKKLKRVFVGLDEAGAREVAVEFVRMGTRGVRIKLHSIESRSAAEECVGSLLFVDEADRVHLPRGKYFVHDIIGMRVISEVGEEIGVVKDVLKLPANDVYVVEMNGREGMIPAVKEFVRDINVTTRTMRVRLIEGMIQEDEN